MWRIGYLPIFMFIYYLLLWVPLYLMGWILIPLAAELGEYQQDSTTQLYHFTWPIMSIYDNDSDGIANNDYWPTVTDMYTRIWMWSANRNPLASITKIPLVHCAINPKDVRFVGSLGSVLSQADYEQELKLPNPFGNTILQYNQKVPCWSIAWDGFFSCWYWQFNWNGLTLFGKQLYEPGLYLLWIGSKIKPTDIYSVESYRTPRTYNTVQFNLQGPLTK